MDEYHLDGISARTRFRTHLSTPLLDRDPPAGPVEHDLRRVMCLVADVTIDIAEQVRKLTRGKAGSRNIFGEEQIKLDLWADQMLMAHLGQEVSFQIRQLASEESDEILTLSSGKGRWSVSFDPLDGSSVVDANLSVGTILGFYDGDLLDGKPGSQSLAAAMYVVYGPATTLVYAVPGRGAHEFVLDNGRFFLVEEDLKMQERGKIYAPGGNKSQWLPAHRSFIEDIERQGYKLRYSGALVADVNHLFAKRGGLFTYPALTDAPNGKLRTLFELQPLALIAEEMGGAATNGTTPILDLIPRELDERSPFYIGSRYEVDLAWQHLAGEK